MSRVKLHWRWIGILVLGIVMFVCGTIFGSLWTVASAPYFLAYPTTELAQNFLSDTFSVGQETQAEVLKVLDVWQWQRVECYTRRQSGDPFQRFPLESHPPAENDSIQCKADKDMIGWFVYWIDFTFADSRLTDIQVTEVYLGL